MDPLIRILHLEDDPADAELVQAMLEEAGMACRITLVRTRDEFDEALRRDRYDIILADYRLPMYDGMSALRLAQELRPDIPFIFVSGTMGEEAATEGLTEGATYYVLKQRLLRLVPAVKRALHETENWRERKRAEKELRASPVYRIVLSHITERKRIEEELRASEERHRTILQTAMDGFWIADMQGRLLEVNESYCRLSGYSKEALLALSISDLEVVEISADTAAHMQRIVAQGEDRFETRHRRKDGSILELEVSVQYKPVDGGRMIAFLRDITERKKAEEKIQAFGIAALRNESRLRSLVDILQHPSETIQDFLDYALDQAIQLTESKIGYIYHYHEDRKEFVLSTWSREVMAECAIANPPSCYELDKTGIWGDAVRQRRPIIVNDFQTDNPLKKGYPEGHVHLFKFITVPIFKDDSIVGVIGLANKETDYEETDILQVSLLMEAVWKVTERKQAEEALRNSEAFLNMLLESIPIPVFYKDREGRYLGFNKAFETMCGISREQLIGKSVFDISPPELAKVYHAKDIELFEKPGVQIYDSQVRDEHGVMHHVIFHKASLIDMQGSTTGLIGAILDITERKQAEEKVHELSQLLMQTQEKERHLISCELHDSIAQNLSVLKINCDTICNDPSMTSPEHREKLAASSNLLLQTIAAVRNLAYDLRLPGLEEMGLVKALESYCEEASENGKTKVDFQSAGMSVIDLNGNMEIHIYRLIQEGLNNIRKHADADHATILLMGSSPNIILRIEDNGRGFDVKAQELLSAATKRMGIRSMQERVNLLQGQMTIRSQPMKGTQIFIKIPL